MEELIMNKGLEDFINIISNELQKWNLDELDQNFLSGLVEGIKLACSSNQQNLINEYIDNYPNIFNK